MNTRTRIWPVWSGSTTEPVKFVPVKKKHAAKLYWDAWRFERRTRKPGHQDGKIGRNGILILHALLFDLIDYATGNLEPAYETIAHHANISIRSVHRGLVKLRESGILNWVRRCAWNDETGQLEQLTNAYGVAPVSQWKGYEAKTRPPAPEAGTWGEHPPLQLRQVVAEALTHGCKRMVQQALDLDPGDVLARALGSFNRRRGA